MEFPENLAELTVEQITELITQARAELDAFVQLEAPTAEQVDAALAIEAGLQAVEAEGTSRVDVADRAAALRERLAAPPEVVPEVVEPVAPVDVAPVADPPPVAVVPEVVPDVVPVAASVVTPTVADVSRIVPRPPAPRGTAGRVSLVASADVPGFPASSLLDMDSMGRALVARMEGFPDPSGNGQSEDLRHFGVANIKREFPAELIIDRHSDDMEVLAYAASEARLSGGSLTASGGWCSPSEVLYDLCELETNEGILSVPEVQVKRGGVKYTQGPDYSSIYTNVGFAQTEAQAIAGTPKTCFEVPCPSWVDVRLDAVGLCIKAPILTNAAYPELVQRWLRGAMIAHQHKVNVRVINAITTFVGAAKVMTDMGTTAGSTLAALELLADFLRSKYRMSFSQTMEAFLPHWVRGAVRNDLALRTGNDVGAITDAMIDAEFAARKVNIQWVYDWQDLDTTLTHYPTTFDVVMYPAGTFVKGTSPIIKLDAVYDAASLVQNIYTALFFEEGMSVMNPCASGFRATIAVCNAGRTGLANIAACNVT